MVINNVNRLSNKASSKDTLNALFNLTNWRSMFIGKAGAGKTHTLSKAGNEYYIELLAPSNLAAMLLGGRTLCSWLGVTKLTPQSLLHIDENKIIRELVGISMNPSYKYRAVYIDEMSFFNTEVFEHLDKMFDKINSYLLSKGLPIIHLIWGGDFLQLKTIGGKPIYNSPLVSNYNIVITPNVYRQKNQDWLDCLSAVREGRVNEVKDYFSNPKVQRTQISTTLLEPTALGPKGIHIVGTNDDVVNQAAFACLQISEKNKTPRYAFWNGYKKVNEDLDEPPNSKPILKPKRYLHLTKGIRVKASNKELHGKIVKGIYGTVQDCSSNTVEVLFDNEIKYTYKYDGKSPLLLEPGGVATVYSIQGITIPEGSIAMVDINATFTVRPLGSLYVCLSRTVSELGTILICNTFKEIERALNVDTKVIAQGLY